MRHWLGDALYGLGQGLGHLLHPAGEEGAGEGGVEALLQVPVLLVPLVLGIIGLPCPRFFLKLVISLTALY